MSLIPIDEVVLVEVTLHHPVTGAVTDGDSAPTFDVFEEVTDSPILDDQTMTKRTSLTGDYRGQFTASTANGFEPGKWYSVIVTAIVGGVTAKHRERTFRAAPAESSAGVPKADVSHNDGTAITAAAGIQEVKVASIAADAITAAAVADNAIDAGAIAADAITAAKIATGAIDADALAADAVTEIQSGLATAAALATVDGIVDDILVDTAEIGTAGAGLTNINLPNQTMDIVGNITGNLSGSVGSVATGGIAAASFAAGAIDAAAIAADAIGASELAASAVAEIQSGLATSSAVSTLQTSVDDLPTNAELATALAAADDAVLAAIAALNNLSAAQVTAAVPTANANADALLKRDWTAVTGEASRSALNALRFLRNKWAISGGTLSVKKEDDSTDAWTGAVTQTAGNPVSEIDPA